MVSFLRICFSNWNASSLHLIPVELIIFAFSSCLCFSLRWSFCRWLGNPLAPGDQQALFAFSVLSSSICLFICCHSLDFKKEEPRCLRSVCLFSTVINYLLSIQGAASIADCSVKGCVTQGGASQMEIPSLTSPRGMKYGSVLPVWDGRRSSKALSTGIMQTQSWVQEKDATTITTLVTALKGR